jgi:hypothetical protein
VLFSSWRLVWEQEPTKMCKCDRHHYFIGVNVILTRCICDVFVYTDGALMIPLRVLKLLGML